MNVFSVSYTIAVVITIALLLPEKLSLDSNKCCFEPSYIFILVMEVLCLLICNKKNEI